MILGEAQRAAINRTTLYDLFRRASVPGPEAWRPTVWWRSQRLAGRAPEQVQTAARLQAAGVNALIVGALQQRHPPDLPYFVDKALTGLS